MKKKINSKKKSTSALVVENDLDKLYVSISDHSNKRRALLSSIKDSLIMQDDLETIKNLRKEKINIINEIKKNSVNINAEYQKLKKILPNVKNVISYTEKELVDLESNFSILKNKKFSEKEEKIIEKPVKEILSNNIINKTSHSEKISNKSINKTESITKLDRIKNNLKVIESKLNGL